MNLFHILLHLVGKKSDFLRKEELPPLAEHQLILPKLPSRWFVTDDFKMTAKNHCASVCVMNALLYFGRKAAFSDVHAHIKNGPVLSMRKARLWFCLHKIRSTQQLNEQLSNGNPCALMLSTPRHEWHWVLVVGYLKSPDGQQFLRIADGWHSNGERYVPILHEHDWISCVTLEEKKKSPIP